MTQIAINYAKVLYELKIPRETILETQEILSSVPELKRTLINPIVSNKKKHTIVEQVFPEKMHNFLKILCDYQSIKEIDEIFVAYKKYYNEQNNILEAKLTYVTEPNQEELEGIKKALMEKHHKSQIELALVYNPEIIGGFIVEAENREADWSLRGRLNKLQQRLVRR